jgi:N-acetylglucosaminyl-diphospho-decaprenol L-rhamnosyltransferase|tara:strand:+ start:11286 stop:12215 length:930 start_codon:yes stop_codon:yes gene_type:complete
MIKTSVILVNFNGLEFLPNCLDALHQNISKDCEVIVVDNCSTDESVSYMQRHHQWIRLIISPTNLGFTGGNNLGALHALGEYLFLVNVDTVFKSGFSQLISIADAQSDFGVLGCRLFYGNGSQQRTIGLKNTPTSLAMSWFPVPFVSQYFAQTAPKASSLYSQDLIDVAWVSGAALLTKKDIWDAIGGLDSDMFMYMEDMDYCNRVEAAGYKVLYTSRCLMLHFEGGGREWIGERAVCNSVRSSLIYISKRHNKFTHLYFRAFYSLILFVRSSAHFLLWLFRIDKLGLEKASAFISGVRILLLPLQLHK